ncbi:hypothetical protein ABK040_004640 [Willaertia magna]
MSNYHHDYFTINPKLDGLALINTTVHSCDNSSIMPLNQNQQSKMNYPPIKGPNNLINNDYFFVNSMTDNFLVYTNPLNQGFVTHRQTNPRMQYASYLDKCFPKTRLENAELSFIKNKDLIDSFENVEIENTTVTLDIRARWDVNLDSRNNTPTTLLTDTFDQDFFKNLAFVVFKKILGNEEEAEKIVFNGGFGYVLKSFRNFKLSSFPCY